MDRLTKVDDYGNVKIVNDSWNTSIDVIHKLAKYEDTGYTPKEIEELKDKYNKQTKEMHEDRSGESYWVKCLIKRSEVFDKSTKLAINIAIKPLEHILDESEIRRVKEELYNNLVEQAQANKALEAKNERK